MLRIIALGIVSFSLFCIADELPGGFTNRNETNQPNNTQILMERVHTETGRTEVIRLPGLTRADLDARISNESVSELWTSYNNQSNRISDETPEAQVTTSSDLPSGSFSDGARGAHWRPWFRPWRPYHYWGGYRYHHYHHYRPWGYYGYRPYFNYYQPYPFYGGYNNYRFDFSYNWNTPYYYNFYDCY